MAYHQNDYAHSVMFDNGEGVHVSSRTSHVVKEPFITTDEGLQGHRNKDVRDPQGMEHHVRQHASPQVFKIRRKPVQMQISSVSSAAAAAAAAASRSLMSSDRPKTPTTLPSQPLAPHGHTDPAPTIPPNHNTYLTQHPPSPRHKPIPNHHLQPNYPNTLNSPYDPLPHNITTFDTTRFVDLSTSPHINITKRNLRHNKFRDSLGFIEAEMLNDNVKPQLQKYVASPYFAPWDHVRQGVRDVVCGGFWSRKGKWKWVKGLFVGGGKKVLGVGRG
ncbi:Nn.00g086920.m01.CDS01 [Neocucurbitaria sp. VM-36]